MKDDQTFPRQRQRQQQQQQQQEQNQQQKEQPKLVLPTITDNESSSNKEQLVELINPLTTSQPEKVLSYPNKSPHCK